MESTGIAFASLVWAVSSATRPSTAFKLVKFCSFSDYVGAPALGEASDRFSEVFRTALRLFVFLNSI